MKGVTVAMSMITPNIQYTVIVFNG